LKFHWKKVCQMSMTMCSTGKAMKLYLQFKIIIFW
jgi:hypothetical protein